MAEFVVEPAPLQEPNSNMNGEYFKNVKEVKVGDGSFYVSQSGRVELRDSLGNISILLDPNG
jgi:hypothetical protein